MQCVKPIRIRNAFFPCGKCISCRIAKSREWSKRLMDELGYWSKSVFVTLTYSDDFLPPKNSLRKRDLQNFFKRLRKYSNLKIKYFACGEYGDNKNHIDYGHGLGRPHYHAIIFGLGQSKTDIEFIKDSWRFCDWSNFQQKKAFGTVTIDSCRYVSDYIFKKYSGTLADEVYLSKGIEIPFKISSQGLGLRFALDNRENIIEYGVSFKGHPLALPRYYATKLGLELSEQSEENFKKWLNYARLKGIHISDVADLKRDMAIQREENLLKRMSLYHKGDL